MPKKKMTGLEVPSITPAQQQEFTKLVKQATHLSADSKKRTLEIIKMGHEPQGLRLEDFDIKAMPIFQVTPDAPCESLYSVDTNGWQEHEGGDLDLYQILDTLFYAVQNGKLNSRTWVKTVFHNEGSWDWFLEELANYEQIHRIRDPWWFTLAALAEHENVEEGFSSSEDIAEAIAEHARETNQVF